MKGNPAREMARADRESSREQDRDGKNENYSPKLPLQHRMVGDRVPLCCGWVKVGQCC